MPAVYQTHPGGFLFGDPYYAGCGLPIALTLQASATTNKDERSSALDTPMNFDSIRAVLDADLHPSVRSVALFRLVSPCLGNRMIARELGIAHATVRRYMIRLHADGLVPDGVRSVRVRGPVRADA